MEIVKQTAAVVVWPLAKAPVTLVNSVAQLDQTDLLVVLVLVVVSHVMAALVVLLAMVIAVVAAQVLVKDAQDVQLVVAGVRHVLVVLALVRAVDLDVNLGVQGVQILVQVVLTLAVAVDQVAHSIALAALQPATVGVRTNAKVVLLVVDQAAQMDVKAVLVVLQLAPQHVKTVVLHVQDVQCHVVLVVITRARINVKAAPLGVV